MFSIVFRCLNWCSKNGICSDPGEAGYCNCNIGYTGADCSKSKFKLPSLSSFCFIYFIFNLEMCPKSFDLLLISNITTRRAIRLNIGRESGSLYGKLKLSYHNDIVMLESAHSVAFTDECSNILSKWKGVSKVSCQVEQAWIEEALSYSYLITFNEWSRQPFENNNYYHSGNPDITEFKCDYSNLLQPAIIKPYCEFTDVITENVPGIISIILFPYYKYYHYY